MFILYADKVKLAVRQKETVTSGSVNVYPVRFEFSRDWDGLDKVAVFRAGDRTVSVLLGPDGETTVPWEVLASAGHVLYAGVYGTKGSETVLPTAWKQIAYIEPGTCPGDESRPPGGGEGGTTDHRFLTGRDAANQHPIDAVTGLSEALETIPRPMTADELRKILTGGTKYAGK